MQNELIIPFEGLLNRGIQRERVCPINNNGFFSKTYAQAFTLINMICAKSKQIETNVGIKTDQYEIHNVIAFTGRRGTGKTSAMLSVADSLSGRANAYFNESDAFIQLPYVNAAVLNEAEDIFLIVLSKLFKMLDEKSNIIDISYESRNWCNEAKKIKEDICKIYDQYVNLKDDKNLTSSYNSMEKLSDKYSIREKFAELVRNYTNIFNKLACANNPERTFHLVICIDDVDMSRQNHMRIMQCIHQYFMIPQMIVMVTLNFPMLTASLQKDSYIRYIPSKDNLHMSFEHTNDFLRKIIPSDMRITMPSWRKYDYRALTPVKVDMGDSSNLDELIKKFPALKDSVLFKKLKTMSKSNYTLSPKALILMILADRTTIYLDAQGSKIHFMEPDSLRNFYDIFYMLYHMNDISALEKSKNYNYIYFRDRKANRKILLDYLYFKLLPEYDFASKEKNLIDEFLADPLERRGMRIWDYYFKLLNNIEHESRIVNIYGREYYDEEKSRYKIENYSFGDLFRVLYSASRIGVMDRKFIKLILASFSFSLPQFVEDEKWKNCGNKPDDKNHYLKLRDIFGYTLLGTWRVDLFNGSSVNTAIYTSKIAELCAKHKSKKNPENVNINNADFKNFISDLMLLLLMTSKSTREAFDVYASKGSIENNSIVEHYDIDNQIDPTAFIMNSLRINERFENMKFYFNGELVTSVKDETGETVYSISILLSKIIENIKCGIEISKEQFNSLVTWQLDEWKNNCPSLYDKKNQSCNTLWFLLKNTDIAYNVTKRAISCIIYNSDNNPKDKKSNSASPFQAIQKFYKNFHTELEKQDKIYFEEESTTTYASLFLSHPVVSKFITGNSLKNPCNTFANGCGISENKPQPVHEQTDDTKHQANSLKYVLSRLLSRDYIDIISLFNDELLTAELNIDQYNRIVDIVFWLESNALNLRKAYNLILLVLKNDIEAVSDELYDIEDDFFNNQNTKRE